MFDDSPTNPTNLTQSDSARSIQVRIRLGVGFGLGIGIGIVAEVWFYLDKVYVEEEEEEEEGGRRRRRERSELRRGPGRGLTWTVQGTV